MTLDLTATYSVSQYPGIAFRIKGYVTEYVYGDPTLACVSEDEDHAHHEDCYLFPVEPDEIVRDDQVIGIMVGDDRKHTLDVDDLTKIEDDDYCSGCGQIGCGH